ncbi:MAG: DUF711 family protein [Anaerolineae bacterium]
MKIRSITYFCNPGFPLDENVLQAASDFLAQATAAYQAAGYEVQTTRLASVPFAQILGAENLHQLPRYAEQLAQALSSLGISYAALGPALPELPRSYQVIPEAIASSENIFFSGLMTGDRVIFPAAVRACAQAIVNIAPLKANGFANLRFAALANVPAGSPFFPAAYHNSTEPAFALACEAADLAVTAFSEEKTLSEARQALSAAIERHGRTLGGIANTRLWHVNFLGIDFSLAPFPDDAHSLGQAVEKMGIPHIGRHGSLAAAALLTEAVERADFLRLGFSGFMQPVLEDSILARRAAEGLLTLKDLLLYSAVCGTGLDTVPLPGNTTAEEITPLLLDLAALALRLDKPLTARLMPIPGKKAGEATQFDFGFFANSRVMRLEATPLGGLLQTDDPIPLQPYGKISV